MAAGYREPVEFRDRLAAAGDHRHSLPVLDVTADGRLDAGRRIGHLTHHDRPVATAHHPLLQLAGEGAMRLGIARALVEYNAELRKALKNEGLLTRDARAKERKKYGMAGARKRFQFSKR